MLQNGILWVRVISIVGVCSCQLPGQRNDYTWLPRDVPSMQLVSSLDLSVTTTRPFLAAVQPGLDEKILSDIKLGRSNITGLVTVMMCATWPIWLIFTCFYCVRLWFPQASTDPRSFFFNLTVIVAELSLFIYLFTSPHSILTHFDWGLANTIQI